MTLDEILQFERNSENVMIGVLSPACENAYHSRQVDTNASPRISCKAIIGDQFQNQMLTIASEPGYIYSAYECRMEVICTTNRTEESKSDAHNNLLGQTRFRCSQFFVDQWQESQAGILPNLITQLKPAENEDSEADTENLDNTKLSFKFILAINPLALPSNL